MTLNPRGKLLVGLQALPLKSGAPGLEEAAGPAFSLVVPQLAKRFLEQGSGMEALVGLPQLPERTTSREGERRPPREQGVLLTLDELAVFAAQPGVCTLAHVVQGLIELTQDGELVEPERGLRGMPGLAGGVLESLPHSHPHQPKPPAFLGPRPRREQVQALFRAILAAEPERPPAPQVAHHDTLGVSFADRNFVDPQHLGCWRPPPTQLFPPVLLVQPLDGLPIQGQFPSGILHRRRATPPPHEQGNPGGINRRSAPPGPLLLFHPPPAAAHSPPQFGLQIDAGIPTRQASESPYLVVVAGSGHRCADATRSFFPRRRRRITRALGSPQIPWTVADGRKPGKRYRSASRREVRLGKACQFFSPRTTQETLVQSRFPVLRRVFSPTRWGEDPNEMEYEIFGPDQ